MKIIVAGATGYLGRQLFSMASKDQTVLGTSTAISNTMLRLRLDEPNKFEYGVIQEKDVVLLTAAIRAPDVCSREHDRSWAVNVTGTSSFISRVISRGARVIFFSSDAVYGERADAFDESTTCNPSGDYAVMKHEVEGRFLGNTAFKTIRLSYVFSSEDKFTKYLCGCVERMEEAEIFHPFCRAVVHRDDVVQGAIALAQRWDEFPQSAINFGGPNVIARTEFAQTLKDNVLPVLRFRQIEPEPEFFTNRPRVIQMTSPVLASLLGRPAHTLYRAIKIEFNK